VNDRKIVHYALAYARADEIKETFESIANDYIQRGYVPHGSPLLNQYAIVQAFIKYGGKNFNGYLCTNKNKERFGDSYDSVNNETDKFMKGAANDKP
jgi:hypothetical protein